MTGVEMETALLIMVKRKYRRKSVIINILIIPI
jgi:hypothetical protein